MEDQEHKQQMVDRLLISNGGLIEKLITSPVWQEIIGPDLHTRIQRTLGHQKEDGRWVHGPWMINDKDRFEAGKAAGLMDFSNSLIDYVNAKKDAIARLSKVETEKDKPDLIDPMMEVYNE